MNVLWRLIHGCLGVTPLSGKAELPAPRSHPYGRRAQAAFACLLKEVTKQHVCQGNVDSWQNINGITFPSIPDLGFKADEPVSSPGRLQDNHNRKENNNDKVKRKTQKF